MRSWVSVPNVCSLPSVGVVTLAALVMLVVLPAAIPSTVGITIGSDEDLLSYLMTAAELGIGVLSIGAAR